MKHQNSPESGQIEINRREIIKIQDRNRSTAGDQMEGQRSNNE